MRSRLARRRWLVLGVLGVIATAAAATSWPVAASQAPAASAKAPGEVSILIGGRANQPVTAGSLVPASIDALNKKAKPGRTYRIGTTKPLRDSLSRGVEQFARSSPSTDISGVSVAFASISDPGQFASAAVKAGLKSLCGYRVPPDLARAKRDRGQAVARVGVHPNLRVKADSTPGATLDPTADYFDWRYLEVVTLPVDQGQCGGCWAFGTAAAFEGAYAIRNDYRIKVSEQDIINCAGQGRSCGGGFVAFDLIVNQGVTLERLFPYAGVDGPCAFDASRVVRAENWDYVGDPSTIPLVADLKKALIDHGPLAVTVNANDNFLAYTGGVFNDQDFVTPDGAPTNHEVALVGWNNANQSWWIKNSWSADWGVAGFMEIAWGSNNIGYNAAWVQAVDVSSPPDLGVLRQTFPDAQPIAPFDPSRFAASASATRPAPAASAVR